MPMKRRHKLHVESPHESAPGSPSHPASTRLTTGAHHEPEVSAPPSLLAPRSSTPSEGPTPQASPRPRKRSAFDQAVSAGVHAITQGLASQSHRILSTLRRAVTPDSANHAARTVNRTGSNVASVESIDAGPSASVLPTIQPPSIAPTRRTSRASRAPVRSEPQASSSSITQARAIAANPSIARHEARYALQDAIAARQPDLSLRHASIHSNLVRYSDSSTDIALVPSRSTQSVTRNRHGGKKGIGKRDFIAEIKRAYPTPEAMREGTTAFDRICVRPLTPRTLQDHAFARERWLVWFTELYQSREAALATLAPDAPFPPQEEVLQFLYTVAVNGQSRFRDTPGWTFDTTNKFWSTLIGMRIANGAQLPTSGVRAQVRNSIRTWAFVDKLLPTTKRPKRFLRLEDLVELTAATLAYGVPLPSNWIRLNCLAIFGLLYEQGHRIGGILEGKGYVGSGEYLSWGDLEVWIQGIDEDGSLDISTVWEFVYTKNKRHLDGDNILSIMHSLPSSLLHICTQSIIITMGGALKVWEEPILDWCDDPKLVPNFPYKLTILRAKAGQPVFVNDDLHTPWSYDAAQKCFKLLAQHLGWDDFTSRSFRYGWARCMMDSMSEAHLKHLLGHLFKSIQAVTTYQPESRPVDITALRFGTTQNLSLGDYRSSVAYGRDTARTSNTVTVEDLENDGAISAALDHWAACEEPVRARYHGKTSMELDMQHYTNTEVSKALDAWHNVAVCYNRILRMASVQSTVPVPSTNASAPLPLCIQDSQSPADTTSSTTLPSSPASESDESVNARVALLKLQAVHPLVPLIAAQTVNPRRAVIAHYLGLLKATSMHETGICPWCFHNVDLTTAQRNKVYPKLTAHMWICDAKQYPDTQRCPMCGLFIALEKADPENSEIQEINNEIINSHCELVCLPRLLDTLGLSDIRVPIDDCLSIDALAVDTLPLTDDALLQIQDDQRARDFTHRSGFHALTAQVYTSTSRMPTHIFFCPICLFDTTRPWFTTGHKYTGRLFHAPEAHNLHQHLYSHWSDKGTRAANYPESGLNYDAWFTCRFPKCASSHTSYTLKEHIEHLHNSHRYKLLVCNQDHDHANEQLHLSQTFRFQSDTLYEQEITGRPLDQVALIDHRRPVSKEAAKKRMNSRLVKQGFVIPGDAPPTVPIASIPSSPAVNPSVETVSPETVSPEASLARLFERFQTKVPGTSPDLLDIMREEELTVATIANPAMLPMIKSVLKLPMGKMEQLHNLAKECL